MRIVHLTHYYMTGLGYQDEELAVRHARAGHEVHVVTSARAYPVQADYITFNRIFPKRYLDPGTAVLDGVTVHRLNVLVELNSQIILRGVRGMLSELGPDIVVAHGMSRFESVRAAIRRRRNGDHVLIVDDHTFESAVSMTTYRRLYYALLRVFWARIGRVDAIVAVTNETCKYLARRLAIPVQDIDVIPLGTHWERFAVDKEERKGLRAQVGIPMDALVVIYAGKLTEEKGVHLLLNAIAPHMEQRDDVHLLLLGSGTESPYARRLAARAAEDGLGNRVHLHPHVSQAELARFFSAADIAVWPWQETMAALQAAAASLPIILRDSEVGREWTRAGNGVVWSEASPLEEALATMIEDPDLRRDMGAKGCAFVREHYDWARIAERFLTVAQETRSGFSE